MIGWREGLGWVRLRPAPVELTSEQAVRELRRALNPATRLRVKRGRITGEWIWRLIDDNGDWLDYGHAATHGEALAVGLAALEAASVVHA